MKTPASFFVWSAIAIGSLLLQMKLSLFGFLPNVTIVAAYAFGLRNTPAEPAILGYPDVRPEGKAILFGAALGLCEDAVTGILVGPGILGKGLAGFLASILFRDVFFAWTPIMGAFALSGLTLMDGAITIVARMLFTGMVLDEAHIFEVVAAQALINFPLGTIVRPDVDYQRSLSWFSKRKYN